MTVRTGYLLGRLLAALEHLGTVERPSRLYEQASITPSYLIHPLSQATATGSERAYDILTPIVGQLPADAFSGSLNAEHQGDFGLGYYHQRAELRAGVLPKLPESEPPADERIELRLDRDLKEWTLANGGGKLIRALLRSARERQESVT